MTDPKILADTAADEIRTKLKIHGVDMAFVLGSGWAAGADRLGETVAAAPLADFTGFSKPVVAGHGGEIKIVNLPSGKLAALFTGRTHYYEGRGVAAVVHGVRTAAALGAETLVLTNGAGGLNPSWAPGTVVLISDHINLTAATPLVGATFVDMSEAYSRRLRALALEVDPSLPEGVYVQFPGPQYETPAEVRMASYLGGNLVGMSTTLETLAAREAGLEVLGLSLVTNAAAGMGDDLDHQEVIEAGKAAADRLADLLASIGAKL